LLLQYSASEMIGLQTPAIIHVEEEAVKKAKELSELYGRPIGGFDVFVEGAKKGEYQSMEWTYVRKDGSKFPVQLVVTAIKGEAGNINGFLGIATDISDLKSAKSELEILTDKLQKQNEQLLNFAHITSHNLRSPVSNLNTVLTLYKESDDEDEKAVLNKHMETLVAHLSETLNQLVDSLKVQEEKGKEREWIKFDEILAKTKEILVGTIIETHAQVTADFSGAEEIEYPPSYLESIVLNLLSNSIKYRSANRVPEIHFQTYRTEKGLILKVSDNGLGIDLKKHGDELFGLNKTFHAHSEAKGVGLFMTKIQIESMGGSIEAESEVEKGITFTINF
jgi:PAS domain S-box-containing protein